MEKNFSITKAISNLIDKLDGWFEAIILKLPNFVVAVLVMFMFYFLAKFIRRFSKKVLFKKISQESIKDILSRILFAVILIIGFFIALGVMDLDKVLTSVLAGAGVIGLAIGLALQATLNNSFSGLLLSFLPKIRLGDFIQTGDISGYVEEISLRNIFIRQTDNEFVVIPNSMVIENPFVNYSWSKRSRIDVACGIGYESDLQKVEDLVRKIITDHFKQNRNEEVEFFFTEFGDSSINFVVRFWIDSTKPKPKLEAKHQAIKLIKQHFNKEGINIPFPIRTLDFGKNKLQLVSETKPNTD
ncbi:MULTISPECIES: mechanosensitive ion channel family protein [Mangrovimonas]|uniref:mechanosensitive ion channel family protein n=1 Tax=Mangrovimonas TaxID=1211036 RepID=UPI0006B5E835|nr:MULTISPECIES: mechanosensitive ion channel family protein [Mangrovimonas]MCF1423105.1 mechanosensitive ion channel family protein [Mangrovimonas futianensis]NIK92645.1 mechanosensitive ion channel [Mangrovimonas sp. CR14]